MRNTTHRAKGAFVLLLGLMLAMSMLLAPSGSAETPNREDRRYTGSDDLHAIPPYDPPAFSIQAALPPAPYDNAQTFNLNSRPGASKTIYLDFDGGSLPATAWGAAHSWPAFHLDSHPDASFSSLEKNYIQIVWAIVAEDYAPFDVNVTTAPQSAAAMVRSDVTDNTWGVNAIIRNQAGPVYNGPDCNPCGGVSQFHPHGNYGADFDYYNDNWTFPLDIVQGWRYTGATVSHEVGHFMDLSHDGINSQEYFDGDHPWGPIMGSPDLPLAQWSKGQYAGATNTQDDIAILSARIGAVPDDIAADAANAYPIGYGNWNPLIGTDSDVDVFRIVHTSGTRTLAARPFHTEPNLDIFMTVRNKNGGVVASSNPLAQPSGGYMTGMGADITFTINPSMTPYYVTVEGVGKGSGNPADQYSGYGSIGRYALSLTS